MENFGFFDLLLILVLNSLWSFGGGWLGSIAKNRTLRRKLVDLEYAIQDQESRLIRETKKRASEEGLKARQKATSFDDELISSLKNDEISGNGQPNIPGGWPNWWRQKMLQK